MWRLQPMWSYYDTEIENGYEIIHNWWYEWYEKLKNLSQPLCVCISSGADSRFLLSWIDKLPNKENIYFRNWKYKHAEFEIVVPNPRDLSKKKAKHEELHSFGFDSLGVCLATLAGITNNFREKRVDNALLLKGQLGQMHTKIIEFKDKYTKENITEYAAWDRKRDGIYDGRTLQPYDSDQLLRLDCHQELLLFHAIIYLIYLDYKFIQFPFKSRTNKDTYSIFEFPLKRAIEIIDGWPLDDLERSNYEYNIKRLRIECSKQRPF